MNPTRPGLAKTLLLSGLILSLPPLSKTSAAPSLPLPVSTSRTTTPDSPFNQEYHRAYPVSQSKEANDVRAVTVVGGTTVWSATKAGVFKLENSTWTSAPDISPGPAYALHTDDKQVLWIGTWNGLYRVDANKTERITSVSGPVSAIGPLGKALLAAGPDGAWILAEGQWQPHQLDCSDDVRSIVSNRDSESWIATGNGLYHSSLQAKRLLFRPEELVSSDVRDLAFDKTGHLWIGSLGGLDIYKGPSRISRLTAADGLPYHDIQALEFAPDGRLWIGTSMGLSRMDGANWSFLHSQRWLLSNNVRDIAFDAEGTAWIATDKGVSAISSKEMTLAMKARLFHSICRQRHVRPPGLVEKCRFPDPSNPDVWEPMDDDNDGQYTAMYLAMESFRFATTGNPEARKYANEAFEALEFLQTVTETPSFVARTVIPSTWTSMADPNEKVTPEEAVERRVRDPRYKIVEDRWRTSSDGQWLWKGDTSSDEITGHMFGYLIYFDLAADETYRRRVQNLVSRIMDGLIDNGYVLRDTDGHHTRWGVWSPERLNHDPDWRVERPINSFEILSFLHTAHHITGNTRYADAFMKLVHDHGYAENAARPKAYGLAERTHIDDELLALAAPGLFLHRHQNSELQARLMLGYAWAYETVQHEQNPFFNFIYGMLGGKDFHLAESLAFLRDTPLDLRQYTIDNSVRNDLKLVRKPMTDPLQLDRMLPPSERGVMRWDKNPWEYISGDFGDPDGHLESCGVFWLLPYWMGRYAGFIGE